jgi:hypothetical protein
MRVHKEWNQWSVQSMSINTTKHFQEGIDFEKVFSKLVIVKMVSKSKCWWKCFQNHNTFICDFENIFINVAIGKRFLSALWSWKGETTKIDISYMSRKRIKLKTINFVSKTCLPFVRIFTKIVKGVSRWSATFSSLISQQPLIVDQFSLVF